MNKISREALLGMARVAGIDVHPLKQQARIGIDTITGDDSTAKLERFAELVLAAQQQTNYVAWKHDCNALLISDFELWVPNCPHCGKPRPIQPPAVATRAAIRRLLMAHGFTVKDGQTDLKPYVFEAAEALLRELSPAVAIPAGYKLVEC